jgi:hypothetical protein
MVSIFAELFGKDLEDMPEEERIAMAKKMLFFLTEMLSLGTLKRISAAVGSERLMPTYDDVQRIYHNSATDLIQIAIKLDHSAHFPEKKVLDAQHSLAGNLFGETLLRKMVADHFYMFPRSYQTRQRMCTKLGIEPSPRMMIGTSERKRKV